MPNLPAHVELAHRAAGAVPDPRLAANLGAYLLGATAPDVRIITRRPRAETHFFDLGSGRAGDGVRGLLTAHPELASPVSDAQAAFVAGYITHLVADETWITTVYRRSFDGAGAFGSAAAAQLFDRAAQLTLDRGAERRVRSLLPDISRPDDGLGAGPITAATLCEWREWVVEFLSGERPYSWNRLRHMAGRISGHDPSHPVNGLADRFLADVPAGLDELHERVPRAQLERYVESAVANLAQAVSGYLGLGPAPGRAAAAAHRASPGGGR